MQNYFGHHSVDCRSDAPLHHVGGWPPYCLRTPPVLGRAVATLLRMK